MHTVAWEGGYYSTLKVHRNTKNSIAVQRNQTQQTTPNDTAEQS